MNLGTSGVFTFSAQGLIDDVQTWVDDPNSNFGWIIAAQNETSGVSARRLGSRELPGNETSGPQLTITFVSPNNPPCG